MPPPFTAPDPRGRPQWAHALQILAAALQAVDAGSAVRRALELRGTMLVTPSGAVDVAPPGRLLVVAAGKAARPMTEALEEIVGAHIAEAVGVTVRDSAGATRAGTLHGGGHPIPDPGSLMAARRILSLLSHTTADDVVLVLLSGGASALLEAPAHGLSLADLQSATSALLSSGATIHEMNTVRKHLSRVKGGGLAAAAHPARVITLAVSDVVGSDPEVIGSGPTVPDPTSFADALTVVQRRQLAQRLPDAVMAALREGADGRLPETPKPDTPALSRNEYHVIAANPLAADAAAARATELGYQSLVLTTWLEGEAREVGRVLAGIAKEVAARGGPVGTPGCIVAGGESTVTLRRLGGQGGRNQELALSAALALDGWANVVVAALATDGVDGTAASAGAIVDGATVRRAVAAGLDPARALEHHDSGPFFATLADALITGPTGTNVNDLSVVLVAPPGV